MAYTGNLPKGLDTSEPAIGTAKVNELDDAIRQIKRALLYSNSAILVSGGSFVIPDDMAVVSYSGSGTGTLTLPTIANVADTVNSIDVTKMYVISNNTSTTGSGGVVTVEAGGSDTLNRLVSLWQHESVIVIANAGTSEWMVITDTPTQDAQTMEDTIPSGAIIQSQYAESAAYDSTQSTIPFDDTKPQQTEGKEFLTCAITPTNASNYLMVEAVIHLGASVATMAFAALFKDADADALSTSTYFPGSSNIAPEPCVIRYRMQAGTTSEITFKIRYGIQTAPYYALINGTNARYFGGTLISSINITEIKA